MSEPIITESADGVTHEFPAGTPDAVINKTMKDYATTHRDPSAVVDAVRSIPGGLAKGVAATVGFPSTALNFIGNKTGVLAEKMGLGSHPEIPDNDPGAARFLGIPTSGQFTDAIGNVTGGFYEPKTTAGRYAETAASFAPALVGGEASLGSKLMGRVLAPAAGSQALGSAVDENTSPALHAAAQVGGAVLGGGLVSGSRALGGALLAEPAPEVTANKYLGRILQQQGATPEAITSNAIPGRGQLGAEALGPSGVGMLATLGRRSGATGEALGNALTLRAANAPSRIMDDYATAAGIHPEAAQGNIDALVDAGRAKAKPLFDEALNSQPAVMTDKLAELSQRPIVKKAMAAAANDIRNGGGDPSAVGLHFDEAGNVTQVAHPTPEAWDLTKKALGQAVERDAFGNRIPDSKSPGNFRISQANRELSSAMGDAIPGYADALKESGDYLSLQSAFDAGQKHILNSKTTAQMVADHVANLSPAEIDAYKGGIANEIFNKAQNARLAPRLLNTPAVQQKLSIALGPDKAADFIAGVQHEISLAKTGARMMPGTGSITSDVLLNAGEQDNAAMLDAGLTGAKALGHALSGSPISAAGHGLSFMNKIGDLRRSAAMNPEVRNELGRLLMLPPEDLAQHMKSLPQATPKNASMLGKLLMEGR